MIEKTNIKEVKKVARIFVDLDIQETQFGPLVIKHPFIESSITMTRDEKGQPQMIDLLNDHVALETWRKELKCIIDSKDSAVSIFWLVVKGYKFAFLKYTKEYLNKADLSLILSECWVNVEYPSRDSNLSKRELVTLFKKCEPSIVMDKAELEAYNNLPEVLTVYRGITEKKAVNIKGMSWTTDLKTAEWFAKRFGKHGIVYKAVIEKRYVYAYFLRRNEFETVIDPTKLQNIEVYADFGV